MATQKDAGAKGGKKQHKDNIRFRVIYPEYETFPKCILKGTELPPII